MMPEDVIEKTKEIHAGKMWIGFYRDRARVGTEIFTIYWNPNKTRYSGKQICKFMNAYLTTLARDILGWKKWEIEEGIFNAVAFRKIK